MKVYIIKAIDYQDHSRILYGLSDQGIISMLARGVKKMNSPLRHLAHPGLLINVTLSQGKLPTIKEAHVIEHYPKAKDDLVKLTVHHLCGEIIYQNVTKDDDFGKLLTFLERTLNALETHPEPTQIALLFELKMLAFLGFALGFSRGDSARVFDLSLYEIVERPSIKSLEKQTYEDFRKLYYADVSQLSPLNIEPQTLRRYLDISSQLYQKHLDFKAHSKALLLSFL